jgi:hypothetical protein
MYKVTVRTLLPKSRRHGVVDAHGRWCRYCKMYHGNLYVCPSFGQRLARQVEMQGYQLLGKIAS